MNDQARTRQVVKSAKQRGAVIGALIALTAGLVPAITLGSTAALALLAHLTKGPLAAGWMAGAAVIGGAFVGAVTAAAVGIMAGAIVGGALTTIIDMLQRFLQARAQERGRWRTTLKILPQGKMNADTEADIRERLAFLDALRSSLHSVVVVGSAAHGARDEGSDYDVVLIGKEGEIRELEDAVAGQVLAEAGRSRGSTMEYTLLRPAETRRLFLEASPFAYALRYGAALQDDGFLRDLAAGSYPAAPGRTYLVRALYETILVPYYGSFRALQQSARKNRCSLVCCESRTDCPGLTPADTAARVILRMLYATLPARGYMPLTKRDVVVLTRRVYGDESAAAVQKAVELCRPAMPSLRYVDLVRFKRFAGARFREILATLGSTPALQSLLADGARMVQGRYGQVRDRNLRRCVAVDASTEPGGVP